MNHYSLASTDCLTRLKGRARSSARPVRALGTERRARATRGELLRKNKRSTTAGVAFSDQHPRFECCRGTHQSWFFRRIDRRRADEQRLPYVRASVKLRQPTSNRQKRTHAHASPQSRQVARCATTPCASLQDRRGWDPVAFGSAHTCAGTDESRPADCASRKQRGSVKPARASGCSPKPVGLLVAGAGYEPATLGLWAQRMEHWTNWH